MPRNYFDDPSFRRAFEELDNEDQSNAQDDFEKSRIAAEAADEKYRQAKQEYDQSTPYLRSAVAQAGQISSDIVAPVMRGLSVVTPDFIEEAGVGGEVPGVNNFVEYADYLNRRADLAERLQREAEAGGPTGGVVAGGLRSGVRSMASMLLLGKFGKTLGGPRAAMGAMIGGAGLQARDKSLTTGKDMGLEGWELETYAASHGLAESIPPAVFAAFGMGGVESLLARQAYVNGIKNGAKIAIKENSKLFAKTMGQEYVEELITGTTQMMIDDAKELNPKGIDPEELTRMAAETFVATAFMAGSGLATQNLTDPERRARRKADLSTPEGIDKEYKRRQRYYTDIARSQDKLDPTNKKDVKTKERLQEAFGQQEQFREEAYEKIGEKIVEPKDIKYAPSIKTRQDVDKSYANELRRIQASNPGITREALLENEEFLSLVGWRQRSYKELERGRSSVQPWDGTVDKATDFEQYNVEPEEGTSMMMMPDYEQVEATYVDVSPDNEGTDVRPVVAYNALNEEVYTGDPEDDPASWDRWKPEEYKVTDTSQDLVEGYVPDPNEFGRQPSVDDIAALKANLAQQEQTKLDPMRPELQIGKGFNLPEPDAPMDRLFPADKLEEAEKADKQYKSRDKVVYMPPAQFLALSSKLPTTSRGEYTPTVEKQLDKVRGYLKKGPLTSIPTMTFQKSDPDGSRYEVSDHEGRHRAIVLQEMGVSQMPVLVTSQIRWPQQEIKRNPDQLRVWPKFLEAQDGSTVVPFPFDDPRPPVTGEDVAKSAAKAGFGIGDIGKMTPETVPTITVPQQAATDTTSAETTPEPVTPEPVDYSKMTLEELRAAAMKAKTPEESAAITKAKADLESSQRRADDKEAETTTDAAEDKEFEKWYAKYKRLHDIRNNNLTSPRDSRPEILNKRDLYHAATDGITEMNKDAPDGYELKGLERLRGEYRDENSDFGEFMTRFTPLQDRVKETEPDVDYSLNPPRRPEDPVHEQAKQDVFDLFNDAPDDYEGRAYDAYNANKTESAKRRNLERKLLEEQSKKSEREAAAEAERLAAEEAARVEEERQAAEREAEQKRLDDKAEPELTDEELEAEIAAQMERDAEEERRANEPTTGTDDTDLSDDELEALINTQMDEDASQEQAPQASSPRRMDDPQPAPPQQQQQTPPPEQPPATQEPPATQQQRDKLQDEIDATLDELKDILGTEFTAGPSAKVIGIVTKLVKLYTQKGIRDFANFIKAVAGSKLGEQFVRDNSRVFELSWKVAAKRDDFDVQPFSEGGPATVAAVLDAQEEVSDEQTAEEDGDDSQEDGAGTGAGQPGDGTDSSRRDAPGDVDADTTESDQGSDQEGDTDAVSQDDESGDVEGGGQPAGTGDTRTEDSRGDRHELLTPSGRINHYRLDENPEWMDVKPLEKLYQNIDALKLMDQIEQEGRVATPEEIDEIGKYHGWGYFKQYFIKPTDEAKVKQSGDGTITLDKLNEFTDAKREQQFLDARDNLLNPDEEGPLREKYDQLAKNDRARNSHRMALYESMDSDAYAAARSSTRFSHYTDPGIATKMWDWLNGQLPNITRPRFLEPSSGNGVFLGTMPVDLVINSELQGIDMDTASLRVARHLYPEVNFQNAKYQDTPTLPEYFDFAVTNVPFENSKVLDGQNIDISGNLSLHNYFFAKTAKQLRNGGVAMFITTHWTMDAKSKVQRQKLRELGLEFVGAVRLDNEAFADIANTKVATDIIVMQKVDPESVDLKDKNELFGKNAADVALPFGEAWQENLGTAEERKKSVEVHPYFMANPKQVIGTMTANGKMTARDNELTVENTGRLSREQRAQQLSRALNRINSKLDKKAYVDGLSTRKDKAEPSKGSLLETPEHMLDMPMGTLAIEGDTLLMKRNNNTSEVVLQNLTDKQKDASKLFFKLRDARAELVAAELSPDSDDATLNRLRKKLNRAYDEFVKRNKLINATYNRGHRKFARDWMYDSVAALEVTYLEHNGKFNKKGLPVMEMKARKADIFNERVLYPPGKRPAPKSYKEALAHSFFDHGTIDVPSIASSMGQSEEAALAEIEPYTFVDPTGSHVLKEVYLSGNIRQKLDAAKKAEQTNPALRRNVDALTAVLPPQMKIADIAAPINAPFVTQSALQRFVAETLGIDIQVVKQPQDSGGGWRINKAKEQSPGVPASTTSNANNITYAVVDPRTNTVRKDGFELLKAVLAGQPVIIKDRDDDGVLFVNENLTAIAKTKMQDLRNKWAAHSTTNQQTIKEVEQRFNETVNAYVEQKMPDWLISYEGMTPKWQSWLYAHQKSVASKIALGTNTLVAHRVGYGKTASGIAGLMEAKRLGAVRKPLIVVPNHLAAQWKKTFAEIYPSANLLAPTAKDFAKDKRPATMNRIQTGNWDAIILPESSFGKLSMSPQYIEDFFNDQIDQALRVVENARRESGRDERSLGELLKAVERLQNSLDKQLNQAAKDSGPFFDELGVDALMVDEAHHFKNLPFYTQNTRVKGINSAGSQKAFDMLMKTDFINARTDNRNVTFLTGTPIANSMTEAWTMMRYLMPKVMKEANVLAFDDWKNAFGSLDDKTRIDTVGRKPRIESVFSKFVNMPQLSAMIQQVADIQMANNDVEVPELAGGKPSTVVIPSGSPMKNFMLGLASRAGNMPSDPSIDNVLNVMGEGSKAAIDLKLVDPAILSSELSKINYAAQSVSEMYHYTTPFKGTQIIWADRGVPRKEKKLQKGNVELGQYILARTQYGNPVTIQELKDKHQELYNYDTVAKTHEAALKSLGLSVQEDGVEEIIAVLENNTGPGLNAAARAFRSQQNKSQLPMFRKYLAMISDEVEFEPGDADESEHVTFKTDRDSEMTVAGINLADESITESRGTPWSVYGQMKEELVKEGVDPDEIAFIHDYETSEQKAQLFAQMNSGEKRILIGNTPKLGTGANIQERLIAAHHLDVPWRPADVEQRDGRILRSGNKSLIYAAEAGVPMDGVHIRRYVTEGSIDARYWDTNEMKAQILYDFYAGNPGADMEELGATTMSFAEVKASASGNPAIMRKVQLEHLIEQEQLMLRSQRANIAAMIDQVDEKKRQRKPLKERIDRLKKELEKRAERAEKYKSLASSPAKAELRRLKVPVAMQAPDWVMEFDNALVAGQVGMQAFTDEGKPTSGVFNASVANNAKFARSNKAAGEVAGANMINKMMNDIFTALVANEEELVVVRDATNSSSFEVTRHQGIATSDIKIGEIDGLPVNVTVRAGYEANVDGKRRVYGRNSAVANNLKGIDLEKTWLSAVVAIGERDNSPTFVHLYNGGDGGDGITTPASKAISKALLKDAGALESAEQTLQNLNDSVDALENEIERTPDADDSNLQSMLEEEAQLEEELRGVSDDPVTYWTGSEDLYRLLGPGTFEDKFGRIDTPQTRLGWFEHPEYGTVTVWNRAGTTRPTRNNMVYLEAKSTNGDTEKFGGYVFRDAPEDGGGALGYEILKPQPANEKEGFPEIKFPRDAMQEPTIQEDGQDILYTQGLNAKTLEEYRGEEESEDEGEFIRDDGWYRGLKDSMSYAGNVPGDVMYTPFGEGESRPAPKRMGKAEQTVEADEADARSRPPASPQPLASDIKYRSRQEAPPRKMGRKRKRKTPVNPVNLIRTWKRLFNVNYRIGRLGIRKARGTYASILTPEQRNMGLKNPESIRAGEENAFLISTAAHEIGHHISAKMDLMARLTELENSTTKSEAERGRRIRKLLRLLDYDQQRSGTDKARIMTEEGIAESIGHLITQHLYKKQVEVKDSKQNLQKVIATQHAAEAIEWVRQTVMEDQFFGPAMREAVAHVIEYENQTVEEKVINRIGKQKQYGDDLDGWSSLMQRMRDGWDQVMFNWVDDANVLKKMQTKAREGGFGGIGAHDAHIRYASTGASNAARALEHGVFDLMTNEVIGSGKTLKDLTSMITSTKDMDRAVAYAYAQHTIEMDRKKPGYNTGIDLASAVDLVAEIDKNKDDTKRYEEFRKTLGDIYDDMIVMRYNAGDIDAENANRILKYYGGNFFSLLRYDHMASKKQTYPLMDYKGQGLEPRSDKGSGRPILHPIDALMRKMQQAYTSAAKSRMNEAIVQNLLGADGMAVFGEQIPVGNKAYSVYLDDVMTELERIGAIDPEQREMITLAAQIKETGGPAEAVVKFKKHFNIDPKDSDAFTAKINSMPDPMQLVKFWSPNYVPDAQNGIMVINRRVGGEMQPQLWQVNAELQAYMSYMPPAGAKWFNEILISTMRKFKAGAVGLNPSFALNNFVIDTQSYAGRARDESAGKAFFSPMFMLGQAIRSAVQKMPGGKSIVGEEESDLVAMFEQTGGLQYSIIGTDLDSLERARKRQIPGAQKFKSVSATSEGITNIVQGMVGISDQAPRLAAGKAYMKSQGYEIKNGKFVDMETGKGLDSKPRREQERINVEFSTAVANATVNFRLHGRQGIQADAYIPFLNAAIRGTARQAEQIANLKNAKLIGKSKDNLSERQVADRQQAINTLLYYSTVAAAGLAYAFLSADREDYKEAKPFERRNHWLFGWGGTTYFRIRKDRDAAVISNLAEAIVAKVMETERAGTSDSLMRNMFNELSSDLLYRIPDPITGGYQGALGVYSNWDSFREMPIETEAMQGTSKRLRAKDRTLGLSKAIGRITGQPAIGLSPVQLEYFLDQLFGGGYTGTVGLAERTIGLASGNVDFLEYLKKLPMASTVLVDRFRNGSVGDLYTAQNALKDEILDDLVFLPGKSAEQGGTGPEVQQYEAAYKERIEHKDERYKQLQTAKGLMSDIRRVEPRKNDVRTYEYEPYINGIARAALGRAELESSPNPFFAKNLPQPIKAVLTEATMKRASSAILLKGFPTSSNASFATALKERRLAIEKDRKWLLDHIHSPIVKDVVKKIKSSKEHKDFLKRYRKRPTYNPQYGEKWSKHMTDLARFRAMHELGLFD